MGFTNWDAEKTMRAGSIRRASSSDDKVWGEQTDVDLAYGVFCAVNPGGGVTAIKSVEDMIHGIVVRDIYENARKDRTANIGHFSHGDSVIAQGIGGVEFKRGNQTYVICSGKDAGKITNKADATTVDLGYWAEAVSGDCVAITLGYQATGVASGTVDSEARSTASAAQATANEAKTAAAAAQKTANEAKTAAEET